MSDSTIDGNDVTNGGLGLNEGGGIYNSGDLDLVGSTLTGNTTYYTFPAGNGGALYNSDEGDVFIANSTIWGNKADNGGGIHNYRGVIDIESSTLAENLAPGGYSEIFTNLSGTTRLRRSIVANSSATLICSLVVIDQGNNLGCDGNPVATGLADDLGYNGGKDVPTLALLAGSNAIDAGGTCIRNRDQRGVSRGDPCDIGAFEFGECADLVLHNLVSGLEIHENCEYIWAHSEVEAGGHLFLRAGLQVALYDGFAVHADGNLTIEIDPTIPP